MLSQPPSAAYMRQWIGSALFLNQCWIIVNWILRNKLQWNFNQNTNFFIHENASKNIVCKMAAILSRGDELKYKKNFATLNGCVIHYAWTWTSYSHAPTPNSAPRYKD